MLRPAGCRPCCFDISRDDWADLYLIAPRWPATGVNVVHGLQVNVSQDGPIPLRPRSPAPGEVLALVGLSGSGNRQSCGASRAPIGRSTAASSERRNMVLRPRRRLPAAALPSRRHGLPELCSVSSHDGARQCHGGPGARAGERSGGAGQKLSRNGAPCRSGAAPFCGAVGRPATALLWRERWLVSPGPAPG